MRACWSFVFFENRGARRGTRLLGVPPGHSADAPQPAAPSASLRLPQTGRLGSLCLLLFTEHEWRFNFGVPPHVHVAHVVDQMDLLCLLSC